MFTLYKEYSIGIKKLSDAELHRESSSSGQTHIGLSEKVFTFLPNTPTQVDGILIYNNTFKSVQCAFSKIKKERSTKVDTLTTNPELSIVKQIRIIASESKCDWFLIWFATDNKMPIFWLINSISNDYAVMDNILSQINNSTAFNASTKEFFTILQNIRSINKFVDFVESKTNFNDGNRLLVSIKENRTFVHLSLDYFRSLGVLDKMAPYFNTTDKNTPITVSNDTSFKLPNMFIFADEKEIDDRNKAAKSNKRWFTDPFIVNGKSLYLYIDWYSNNQVNKLMISDFTKFVRSCFGVKYVYRNEQGVNELWEINNIESWNINNVERQSSNSNETNYENESSFNKDSNTESDNDVLNVLYSHPIALQIIYYGAPGTGKSNTIKKLTGEGEGNIKFGKNFTFRTTFHPDSDYASFVGAYKPIWNGEKIIYDFRPQTFLKAYVAAWTHPNENVALIIEEINRGNCSQIFGDIFQLLDREISGLSTYPIETDIDMKNFLSRAFSGKIKEKWAGTITEDYKEEINEYYSKHYDEAFENIKNGEILALPNNLSILATMNTSDQSLFPMDSAFKRRWDWKYIPIVNAAKNWKIKLDNDHELIGWWDFLTNINAVIGDLTTSEDKKLGYFFCQPDELDTANEEVDTNNQNHNVISAKRFVEKVIFYLWNDVFKDYSFDAICCKDKQNKEVLFTQFFDETGKVVDTETLKQFFTTLSLLKPKISTKAGVNTPEASGEKVDDNSDANGIQEQKESEE